MKTSLISHNGMKITQTRKLYWIMTESYRPHTFILKKTLEYVISRFYNIE